MRLCANLQIPDYIIIVIITIIIFELLLLLLFLTADTFDSILATFILMLQTCSKKIYQTFIFIIPSIYAVFPPPFLFLMHASHAYS